MGLSHFRFTGIFLLLHLTGKCLCTSTVKHYHLKSPATRVMSEGFMSYSGVSSSTRCFARCAEHTSCYYVSYDELHGRCILSEWDDGGSISAAGWSLFRLDPPGPDIWDYFSVGSSSLAISSQHVNKTEAESLCASFGFGRLVEIRTATMYEAISNYLKNMSQDQKDMYGNIWMAGEYINSNFRFPDGSPMPITAANDYDTDGSAQCICLRKSESYMYEDKKCFRRINYMCERVM